MAAGSEIITGKNFDSPDETRRPFEKGRIDPGWSTTEAICLTPQRDGGLTSAST